MENVLISLSRVLPTRFKKAIAYPVFRALNDKATFTFNGHKLTYAADRYNDTWYNERAVEIPIALDLVKKYSGGRILEVGNVLSHYSSFPHQIVDKYEVGQGVTNIDVVNLSSTRKYDLIISISTLEHVGFEEEEVKPDKYAIAMQVLKGLLNRGGELFVSLPLGFNPKIDQLFLKNQLLFHSTAAMHRLSVTNRWGQCRLGEAKKYARVILGKEPVDTFEYLILGRCLAEGRGGARG